ncbi:ABC transporter [Cutibacterium acnes JCM 18916]|nr:ABC transporter [Cutibacterium acnes JCM 18916]
MTRGSSNTVDAMLTTTRPHPRAADTTIRGAHLRALGLTKTYG